MRLWQRFKQAKWYTKIIIIGTVLALIPAFFISFLVVSSWIRWDNEKSVLITQVDNYYNYIKQAEQRRKPVYATAAGKDNPIPTRIFDRNGKLIGEYLTEKKLVVAGSGINNLVRKAVIAMEDTDFYSHKGFNLKRIINAAVQNVLGMGRGGGSTITQQLAKLLFTQRERSLQRKIFEFFGARELESRFSKDDILLLYLNTVYFGFGTWGVEAASQLYFDKPASQLGIYESTLLAGLLSRPEAYSPLKNINAAKRKHIQSLNRMVKVFSKDVQADVLGPGFERFWQKLEKRLSSPSVSYWKMRVNRAPYFIEFVRQQLQKYFKDKTIISGGLRVYTTLDQDMQRNARVSMQNGLKKVELAKQREIVKWLAAGEKKLQQALKNTGSKKLRSRLKAQWKAKKKKYLAAKSKPIEGALVSMDSSNGYVLALIGGRNYSFKNELNRAVFAKRQFGSAMKPFVYATALEQKMITAISKIKDKKRTYSDHGRKWTPKNYDHRYLGNITVRDALRKSINTVAVNVIHRLGPDKVADRLEQIFFKKRDFPEILSLALGAVTVSPLDGARLYCALASGGYRVKPIFIRQIKDRNGKVLYDFEKSLADAKPEVRNSAPTNRLPDTLSFSDDNASGKSDAGQVFDPGAVFIVTDMMKDVFIPGGTGFYARQVHNFNLTAAGKSGTSDDLRDAWFAGFVKDTVAVVWVGYDDDSVSLPKNMSGGVAAGPIWTDFMKKSFWNLGHYRFEPPRGIVRQEVCLDSGMEADVKCTNTVTEFFLKGTELERKCNLEHKLTADSKK